VIAGAAIVPTAPLLVAGVTERLPDGVGEVATWAATVLGALPPHDVVVLIAVGSGPAVGGRADAHLAGIGRPDLRVVAPVDERARVVAAALGSTLDGAAPLPLGHVVLIHLYATARGGVAPVVPITVAADGDPEVLQALGRGIEEALGDARAVIVVAGDLSAGLTDRAPLALIPGARAWDDGVVDVVASGRLGQLRRFGPTDAARVGSMGWAPLMVLHGICERARLATVVRCYAAPRGVGYLVASAG
jgi:hypothetical protein